MLTRNVYYAIPFGSIDSYFLPIVLYFTISRSESPDYPSLVRILRLLPASLSLPSNGLIKIDGIALIMMV